MMVFCPAPRPSMDTVFSSLAQGIAFVRAGRAQRVGVNSKWVAWMGEDGEVRHEKMWNFQAEDE